MIRSYRRALRLAERRIFQISQRGPHRGRHRRHSVRERARNAGASGSTETVRAHHLRKIDFVWMNRDQYAFEWFRELLGELERLDRRGLLDIHLFMTGARTGATSVGLRSAREVLHAAGRSDIVRVSEHTRTPVRDWKPSSRASRGCTRPIRATSSFAVPPGWRRRFAR